MGRDSTNKETMINNSRFARKNYVNKVHLLSTVAATAVPLLLFSGQAEAACTDTAAGASAVDQACNATLNSYVGAAAATTSVIRASGNGGVLTLTQPAVTVTSADAFVLVGVGTGPWGATLPGLAGIVANGNLSIEATATAVGGTTRAVVVQGSSSTPSSFVVNGNLSASIGFGAAAMINNSGVVNVQGTTNLRSTVQGQGLNASGTASSTFHGAAQINVSGNSIGISQSGTANTSFRNGLGVNSVSGFAVAASGGTVNVTGATVISTTGATAYGAFINGTGRFIIQDARITTQGTTATGLVASAGLIQSSGNVTIQTSGATALGLLTNAAGTARFNQLNIRTNGANAPGIAAAAANSLVEINTANIITMGVNSHGIEARAGAKVVSSGHVVVDAYGGNSKGILTESAGSQIHLASAKITSRGSADTTSVARGINALAGSTIIIDGLADVTTSSRNGAAIIAGDLGSSTNTGIIRVGEAKILTADNGLYSLHSGSVIEVARDANIALNGTAGNGIHATGGLITVGGTTNIDHQGSHGYGVWASANGTVNLQNANINLNSVSSLTGVNAAFGGYINAKNINVVSTGNKSSGIQASSRSHINVSGAINIDLSGTRESRCDLGVGLCISGVDSSIIAGSSDAVSHIKTSGSAVVMGDGNALKLSLDNANISTTGTAQLLFTVHNANGTSNILLKNSVATTDPTGYLLYASTVNLAHATAERSTNFVFEGNNSTLLGGILASDNAIINARLTNNSVLTGLVSSNINDTSMVNLNVDASSVWNVTGNSILGSLVNSGVIRVNKTGGYKTIAADNYIGTNASIIMNTYVGADGSPSDVLIIDGGSATGTTKLDIINNGGPGRYTLNGVKVVNAVNGGTTNAGAFSLANEVIAGAFVYSLERGPAAAGADAYGDAETLNDWYLRSTSGGQPNFQESAHVFEAYPQLLLGMSTLPTLQQRVGNRQWASDAVFCEDPSRNPLCNPAGEQQDDTTGYPVVNSTGFWTRLDGGIGSYASNWSTTGGSYDASIGKVQAGVDFNLHEEDGSVLVGGLTAHYGAGKAKTSSRAGNGTISTHGYGVGATLTWYGVDGLYVDAQGQYSWYKSDVKSSKFGTLAERNNGHGYSLSIEAGQRFAVSPSWIIIPQAQLIYSAVDFDSLTQSYRGHEIASISLDDGRSLKGRLGVASERQGSWMAEDGTISRSTVYGIANLHYEFLKGTVVDMSGTSLIRKANGLWAGVGVGGSYNWGDDKYSIYGEGTVNTSLNNFARSYDFSGTVGLRVKW